MSDRLGYKKALSLPAILSLISATVQTEKQTMGVSLHSLIRRIPMALGPVFGKDETRLPPAAETAESAESRA